MSDRYRKTFKSLEAAKEDEMAALARLKKTGSANTESKAERDKNANRKTLRDAYDLTWKLHWSQDKSPKSHEECCRYIFRSMPAQMALEDITMDVILESVEEWEDHGNSGSTINRKLSHLRMMLKVAVQRGWLATLPVIPTRKEGKHRIRWMNEAEELRALTLCSHLGLDELRDFIIVAIDTGFRRGELLGLTPNDFFNGAIHLHEGATKTDRARAVPATARVAEILTRRADKRLIFSLTVASLRHQWRVLKAKMGLEDDPQFVVHMLRHTCASRLVQRGVPLAVVQMWMGHSNIATTLRYAHLSPDSLMVGREALEKVLTQPTLRVVNG
jgi:integrase